MWNLKNKTNIKKIDSQIQRTNYWLPVIGEKGKIGVEKLL